MARSSVSQSRALSTPSKTATNQEESTIAQSSLSLIACDSSAEVFLFDDPLSAVDPEVANHIFSKVIEGMLKDKTVLLVTHALNFCPRADQIVFIDGGKVAACGTYDVVMSSSAEGDASFAALINEHGISSTSTPRAADGPTKGADAGDESATADLVEVSLDEKSAAEADDVNESKAAGKGLVEDEEVAQGQSKYHKPSAVACPRLLGVVLRDCV